MSFLQKVPIEVACSILQWIDDPFDLNALMSACRFMYSLLRDTPLTRMIWRRIRANLFLPDAANFGVDDRTLTIRFWKRWCGMCHRRVMLLYDFGTIRLCYFCTQAHTTTLDEAEVYLAQGEVPQAEVDGTVRFFLADMKASEVLSTGRNFTMRDFTVKRQRMSRLRAHASVIYKER